MAEPANKLLDRLCDCFDAEYAESGIDVDTDRAVAMLEAWRADIESQARTAVTPSGWVRCSERMPEPETQVLIALAANAPWLNVAIQIAELDGDGWSPGAWSVDSVTHWMPLPAPPQGDSNG